MRARFVCAISIALVCLLESKAAYAAWPDDRPTEVIVGFAAGGGTDIMARKLLPLVEKHMGGNAKFIVANRPGASGEIAVTAIMRATDAYTIGIVNVPGYNFLPMTRPTQYDTKNLRLIARVVDDPSVLVVRANSRFRNLADVVDELRAKPGSLTIGHNGVGTNGHLAIRMLAKAASLKVNEIGYKGTAAQRTDILGGHLDIGMLSVGEVPDLHGDAKGDLRVIAILAKERSAVLPGVATAEETGFPVIMSAERGFAVNRNVSDEIVRKLETAIANSIRDPAFINGSPGDAPVLAFLPGAEWQSRIDDLTEALRPLAAEMQQAQK